MKHIKAVMILTCLFVVSALFAHGGATGIVKERMDAMKDMGDKTKVVVDMFKGKRDFDRAAVLDAAESFVTHGSTMAGMFPDTKKSRTGSNTEALPLIWDEWSEFSNRIDEFSRQSNQLVENAKETEDVATLRRAFFKATKGCSDCHKRFRRPSR